MKANEKAQAGSLQEVVLFALMAGATEQDGAYLWHKWEANDWRIAGRKIKNWRSALLAWLAAEYLPSQRHKRDEQLQQKRANLPSAQDVRRVIRENRDRMIGLAPNRSKEKWAQLFCREFACSYEDAMKALGGK